MSTPRKSVPLSYEAATDAVWLLEHMVDELGIVLSQAYGCDQLVNEIDLLKIRSVRTTARYLSVLLDFDNCLRHRIDPGYDIDWADKFHERTSS
ncbi:hypothetical protein [Haliea sp.]